MSYFRHTLCAYRVSGKKGAMKFLILIFLKPITFGLTSPVYAEGNGVQYKSVL